MFFFVVNYNSLVVTSQFNCQNINNRPKDIVVRVPSYKHSFMAYISVEI